MLLFTGAWAATAAVRASPTLGGHRGVWLAASSADDDAAARPARRTRYAGRYPRAYKDKYKELQGDELVLAKVKGKGMTPAGQHLPIMLEECLAFMGLGDDEPLDSLVGDHLLEAAASDNYRWATPASGSGPLLAVDCTVGYGGHSTHIISKLLARNDASRHLMFDQDSEQIIKTEARLRDHINATLSSRGHPQRAVTRAQGRVRMANRNFRELAELLAEKGALGSVDCLLADLGFSSMQIDDPERGFTYKASGPLDMRMDPSNTEQQTAYELLCQMAALGQDGADELASVLVENSDEEPGQAREIAAALLESGAPPATTGELSSRVRGVVRRLDDGQEAEATGRDLASKKAEDAVLARVFQSLRICVNQEFGALDDLLEALPDVMAPGGRVVILTFHSGEDRRVKAAFKEGMRDGAYEAWSRYVVRPSSAERRQNPRSSCCKLRWAVRSSS